MKIVSENRFSGKTYFYTIASRSEFGELKQIYDESVKNTNALEAEIAGLKGEHETEKVGDE